MSNFIRVDNLLTSLGLCARRKALDFLQHNTVVANQILLTEPGQKVDEQATVVVNGQPVLLEKLYYIALNKPAGYLCSSSDPYNRPLALNLIPQRHQARLYNVGRLDYDSCGLIFFTNDGLWTKTLSHPSSQIEKEYYVETFKPFYLKNLEAFKQGLTVEGEHYRLKDYRVEQSVSERRSSCHLILTEGKNREIRKIFQSFNAPVKLLKRVRIGQINLGNLSEGQTRLLSRQEKESFHQLK